MAMLWPSPTKNKEKHTMKMFILRDNKSDPVVIEIKLKFSVAFLLTLSENIIPIKSPKKVPIDCTPR